MAIAILLLLLAGVPAAAGVSIQNVPARKTVSLNGSWQTIVDQYGIGYPRRDPSRGYNANRKPQSPGELIEYDFDRSPLLIVPADWNTQRPELLYYEGTMWYKRDFNYRLAPGRRLFVHFGAANYRANVFLNGEKLGEHVGGFTPFAFEITKQVRETGNFLIVAVDNARRADGVPTLDTDWWNYGGLTRDVQLVDVPETFVEDYKVQLAKGKPGHISGWVRLNGARAKQKVALKIAEAGLDTSVETDDQGYAAFDLDARLTLWTPDAPKLYDVAIEAATDGVRDSIGFRTIETRGVDILLNGKPVFLRGVTMHAEAPFRTGRAWSDDDARTLLGWAKELNCNFVRLAHYPHDERMTRLADRLGLMVWSEIPVYWSIQFENQATYANAEAQLDEMITRDKNRASVILWSVANETPSKESRLSFLTRLANRVHEQDPARLVTAALFSDYTDPNTKNIQDPLGQALDVIGCNEYIGWYDGPPAKADGVAWKSIYDKPLIMSEFGGGAVAGNHGDDQTIFTEEYQRSIYEHQIGMFKRIPFLRGTSPWVLMDFRSPRRPLARVQDGFNRKGLLSERGQRKQAFFVLQKFYESMKAEQK